MYIHNPSATFTRPNDTTAYTSGDLVANSTTAGSVVPMQFALGGNAATGSLRLVRARMSKSTTSTTNASFRLHLYQVLPTVANGDNGAWTSTGAATGTSADWLGNIDITSMLAFSDGCVGTGSLPAGSEAFLKLSAGRIIYGLLEARGAYTPGALEVFTVTIEEVHSF